MIGFFVKKTFFDGWDSLFKMTIYNVPFAFFVAGIFAVCCFIPSVSVVYAVLAVSVIVISVYFCSLSEVTYKIADNKKVEFSDFKTSFVKNWKIGISVGFIFVAFLAVVFFVIPFYLSKGNFENTLISAFFFWFLLVFLLAFQWAIPVHVQLNNTLGKSIKKGCILLLDNPGLSVFLFIYSIFRIAISCFLLFLFPSLSGLSLVQNEAFKLLLYKYDWLEEKENEFAENLKKSEDAGEDVSGQTFSPKQLRKQIPWDKLLEQDKEILGKRTFKNFIFPWKD